MMALLEIGMAALSGVIKTWMASTAEEKLAIEARMLEAVKGLLAVREETGNAHDARVQAALDAIAAKNVK